MSKTPKAVTIPMRSHIHTDTHTETERQRSRKGQRERLREKERHRRKRERGRERGRERHTDTWLRVRKTSGPMTVSMRSMQCGALLVSAERPCITHRVT